MIKILKSVSFTIIVLLAGILISACRDDDDDDVVYECSINGKATISKDPVKIGDEVYLSIGPLTFDIDGQIIKVDANQSTTINGKRIIPKVHYFIDDNEVGVSNDPETKFATKYVVSLNEGTHNLRAEAEPQEKNITFSGNYQSSTFTVEAVKE